MTSDSTDSSIDRLINQHFAGRGILLPMASVRDILSIPGELFAKF